MRVLSALFLLCLSGAALTEEERQPRFYNGFDGLMQASADIQRTLLGINRNIGSALSRNIERQVQGALPSYLTTRPHQPVEAVIGGLGSHAVDDGLRVVYDGESGPQPAVAEEAEVVGPESGSGSGATPGQLDDSLFTVHINNNRFDPFGLFGSGSGHAGRPSIFRIGGGRKPWWQGENVCVNETEVEEQEQEQGSNISNITANIFRMFNMEQSSCQDNDDLYRCTTRVRRRGISRTVYREYRCCHGYQRLNLGACDQVNLKSMTATLTEIGREEFLSTAKNHGLSADLLNQHNITVFAPSDTSMEDFFTDIMDMNNEDISTNEVLRRRRRRAVPDMDMNAVVNAHIVRGVHYTSSLTDEQILSSQWSNSSLRVNVYGSGGAVAPVMTANCARVVATNMPTERGIVHTVDRVIRPATLTLWDVIASDSRFSMFKKLVQNAGMEEELRAEGQMTVLVPSDAVFAEKLTSEDLALLDATACLPEIVRNHILPNVICSAAVVTEEARVLNLLKKFLRVERERGDIRVGGAKIVARDIMATNGVIHVIDHALIPTEAKKVISVLEGRNLTQFVELLREAEMLQEIDQLTDSAIFAPTNEAIARMDAAYLRDLRADVPRLRSVLRHHLLQSSLQQSQLRNNHLSPTHSGHNLRMNIYAGPLVVSLFSPVVHRSRLTANCARVTLTNSRACGAQVHVVDEVLVPAEDDILTSLKANPQFSIFSELVQNSSAAAALYADAGVPLTVLAPSDHVFHTLPADELREIRANPALQEELVLRHTLKEHICCSGITPSSLFRNLARTAHGSALHFRQTSEGFLKAGQARITKCGNPHTNGVAHTVDRLFVEPHVVASNPEWSTERRTQPFNLNLNWDNLNLFQ